MQPQQEEQSCVHWLCFKTWNPFSSMKSILISSLILGLTFLILSIVLFVIYSNSFSLKTVYAVNGHCEGSGSGTNCQMVIDINQNLQPPILLLYTLDNAYINHRKYISSFSQNQLGGKAIDVKEAEKFCTPFVKNKDLGVNKSYTGAPLDPEQIAYPCGFKAFLTFNDTYKLYGPGGKEIPINEKQLDNEYGTIFHSRDGSENQQWISVQNQHYQQWTKNQAMISKFKLWGRIEEKLPKGTYNLIATNIYKIGEMRIQKGVELNVPSKMGGPIYFFPWSFLVMGLICVGYAIFLRSEMTDYDTIVKQQ